MSKLTILDKAAVIRNETQLLANTRGRVADVLEDIANTLVDEAALNNEATARDQGDQDNANAIAAEATARAQGDAMKLDKPNSDGSYYIAKTTVAGIPYYQYRVINLSSGQIPVSMGSYIGASLLYESVSGRIGLDTPNPSEKFEVYNGRVKSDGFILTSSAVSPLPKEIKFKGGNFVGAKDDGIERKFLMEGDVNISLLGDLVLDYVHNGNTEIYINSIDYSTARITTNGAHGLNIGQTYSNVIIAPNNWYDYDLTINLMNFQNLFKVFPFEWFAASAQIRIYVVDSTTLEIRNSSNIALTVNQTSVENNGYLDSSKWHIEICPFFNLTGIELGVLRFQLEMEGITNNTNGYFGISVYGNNNSVVYNSVSAPKFNARDVINMPSGVSGRIFNYFNFTLKTSVDEIFNNTIFVGYTYARNTGADSFSQQTNAMNLYKLFLAPNARNNNGIHGFHNNPNFQFHFANGTKIRIYKY